MAETWLLRCVAVHPLLLGALRCQRTDNRVGAGAVRRCLPTAVGSRALRCPRARDHAIGVWRCKTGVHSLLKNSSVTLKFSSVKNFSKGPIMLLLFLNISLEKQQQQESWS
jgi:hypothetical protein